MSTTQTVLDRAFLNNEKCRIIPIDRLQSIRFEVERFRQQEDLNDFQSWIVDNMYEVAVPDVGFAVKSIILIAIPHPFHTTAELVHGGTTYRFPSLVMSDFDKTDQNLKAELSSKGYHVKETGNIPLKRLAVQSGLAEYGRNNICYIDEMGSNFSFSAYYSDIPWDGDDWRGVTMAERCEKCGACLKNCPTEAIRSGRFLIDNERCLSFLNESGDPFPAWLPESAHHCIYDCLKCQVICPMNKEQVKRIAAPVRFTETETNALLSGMSFENYSASLQKKARYLGLDQWPDGISRNIQTLIDIDNRFQMAATI